MTILSILDQVAATTKGSEKLAILEKNKANPTLKAVVYLALNPMINFYQKKIPDYSAGVNPRILTLAQALDLLADLSNRVVTGNAAIRQFKNILESVSKDDATVIERVVTKDLRCGVAIATANKVWGDGFIKEFPVMKASPLDEKTIARINYPAISQLKVDGLRCTAVMDGDDVTLFSSAGNPIELGDVPLMATLLSCMTSDFVIDGELVVVDEKGKILPRKTGNGIINKAVRGTITKEEADRVRFIVFDAINKKSFFAGTEDTTIYSHRLAMLNSHFKAADKHAQVVAGKVVNSEAEAYAHFRELYNKGEEGTILKDMRSIWENKRSKLQVKFKGIISTDLRVKACEEGTGKNKGKIGALVCETDDGLLEVKVGTGLSDDDRSKPFDFYVGKIVEVEYNELIISKVKGAKHCLFLPRFVCVRDDKLHADTLDIIQNKGAK